MSLDQLVNLDKLEKLQELEALIHEFREKIESNIKTSETTKNELTLI